MKTKIKVVKVRDGSFDGRDGERVDYYWVKAVRISDSVTFEFGSKGGGDYAEGQEYEVNLEKSESPKGGFRYKEISTI